MIELAPRLDRKRGTRREPEDLRCEPSVETIRSVSEDFSLLAHPVRLHILNLLAQHGGQVCVCDLEAALPVKQPTISHHLKILRGAGLIDDERHGLWAYYSVRKDRLSALRRRISDHLEHLG